jgi:hypothetical protein
MLNLAQMLSGTHQPAAPKSGTGRVVRHLTSADDEPEKSFRCAGCGDIKPESDWYWLRRKNGTLRRSWRCRTCVCEAVSAADKAKRDARKAAR